MLIECQCVVRKREGEMEEVGSAGVSRSRDSYRLKAIDIG